MNQVLLLNDIFWIIASWNNSSKEILFYPIKLFYSSICLILAIFSLLQIISYFYLFIGFFFSNVLNYQYIVQYAFVWLISSYLDMEEKFFCFCLKWHILYSTNIENFSLVNSLVIKELSYDWWYCSDCRGSRTCNHLFSKETLNHLSKLAK